MGGVFKREVERLKGSGEIMMQVELPAKLREYKILSKSFPK